MKKQSAKKPLPEPPAGLSEKSQVLWRAVVDQAGSPGRRALLQESLMALDRANECREKVNADGMTTVTERSGAIHTHPLLAMEERFRRQFAAAWTALNMQSMAGLSMARFDITNLD